MAIAAIGQLCSTASMTHNLEQCVRLISRASKAGAKVLFLPEASDYIATSPQESLSLARPVTESPFVLGLQSAAKEHGVAVHVGIHVPVSVRPATSASNAVVPTVADEGAGTAQTKLLNRTIFIDAAGSLSGSYDKLHLFDYGSLKESEHTQAGTELLPPFDTAVGRLGSLICFDLRFPEPSLRLAHPGPGATAAGWLPAHILAFPSAFTVATGRAHWEVMLRARAIEAQAYVVAAAQVGPHAGPGGRRVSYGHSMAVDPWGRVVCQLGGISEDGVVEEGAVGALGLVEVDVGEWERVRREMPLVRRTDIYPEI